MIPHAEQASGIASPRMHLVPGSPAAASGAASAFPSSGPSLPYDLIYRVVAVTAALFLIVTFF